MSESYSTKRNTNLGNNIKGAPITYLAGLLGTPVWNLRADTIESLGISSPRKFKEVYLVPNGDTLPDIREGDILVGSEEFRIDSVAEWPDLSGGVPCLVIVIQQIKSSWPTVEPEP